MDETYQDLPPVLQQIDRSLLQLAFTHRSLRARQLRHEETNERLEFLGDAVLELIISEYLYLTHPHWDEGRMTRYRAAIVRTETLAYAAEQLDLGRYLRLNTPDLSAEGPLQPSLLADVFEAMVGALYLNSGYEVCHEFLQQHLLPYQETFSLHDAKDAKSLLQEKLQSEGKLPPVYEVIAEQGPDHAKTFTVEAQIEGFPPVHGKGLSKQKAEQDAASNALEKHFPELD